MPYIKEEDRGRLRHDLIFLSQKIETEGELNYSICFLLKMWLAEKGMRYATLNALMGVLSSVTQEFYRRVVAPYEDQKKGENGDVF